MFALSTSPARMHYGPSSSVLMEAYFGITARLLCCRQQAAAADMSSQPADCFATCTGTVARLHAHLFYCLLSMQDQAVSVLQQELVSKLEGAPVPVDPQVAKRRAIRKGAR